MEPNFIIVDNFPRGAYWFHIVKQTAKYIITKQLKLLIIITINSLLHTNGMFKHPRIPDYQKLMDVQKRMSFSVAICSWQI